MQTAINRGVVVLQTVASSNKQGGVVLQTVASSNKRGGGGKQ